MEHLKMKLNAKPVEVHHNEFEDYMPLILYQRLIQCGILKRSPEVKENFIFKRVELDEVSKNRVKSGAVLASYALVLQELLDQNNIGFMLSKKPLNDVIARDSIQYRKKNWQILVNELLEGRVRISADIRQRVLDGDV